MSNSYTPSSNEIQRYQQLLSELTPSIDEYQEYENRVRHFTDVVRPMIARHEEQWGIALSSLRRRKSKLFGERAYLLAYVRNEWFQRIAPTCDAIASLSLDQVGQPLGVPPLVFVPEDRRRSRSVQFQSILEHEFVHINQALLGRFPMWPNGKNAEDLLSSFFAHTRIEYEANLLQLTRWPQLYPQEYGLSLEHWCVLRGYTQALESHLGFVDRLGFTPEEVERFLELLPVNIPDSFCAMGMNAEMAAWFEERMVVYVAMALQILIESYPELKHKKAFKAIGYWLKDRN